MAGFLCLHVVTPPLRPSPEMGGDWLRADGDTRLELKTNVYSSLVVVEGAAAIAIPLCLPAALHVVGVDIHEWGLNHSDFRRYGFGG